MVNKIGHKETDIIIEHKISVDSCISEEIKKLNNENNILTVSSCCGHGNTGYIIVCDGDIKKMIGLEYDMTIMRYLDGDITSDETVMCAFKPKSKCICKT